MIEFCVLDCSSLYFDVSKDRLYTYAKNAEARRSGQTALFLILKNFLSVLAPILPFTAEEAWQIGLEKTYWEEKSVLLSDFPTVPSEWKDENLNQQWELLLQVREKAHLALESARKSGQIGASLEAKLIFSGELGNASNALQALHLELPMIFIVSQVELRQGNGAFEVFVEKASGSKCVRCWRYDTTVQAHEIHPNLCHRCIDAIRDQQ
jgi:isoleucyl-tRNA synthetase